MTPKSEHLVNLIFNKFKNYKRKKIFLERENFHSNWKGIHTHFSLNRGVPQQSYGNFK